MTATPDTIAAQKQQAIRAVNAMRLGIARRLTAEAQAAGDAAYAEVEARGGSNTEKSDAYHAAYVSAARASGVGAVCHCQRCAASAESA